MTVRKLIATAGVLAVATWTSSAVAGDYHRSTTLVCSDCHVMHYSQQHGYNPNGGGVFVTPANGPHHYLLRNDINDLCLSCHDGQTFAPDVFRDHPNGYVRQAGALNDVGGASPYFEADGHTLNSTATAPGSSPALSFPDGLNCTNCHAPHGRADGGLTGPGGYRNLFPRSISYSRGDVEITNDLTKWIFEDASSGVNGNHYGFGGIVFNEPDATKSAYANFCQQCHTNFHGDVGGAEIGGTGTPPVEFIRHPASTANIGAVGGGHSSLAVFNSKLNNVQVMSPTGQRPPYDTTLDAGVTPSCFSCHKGHGNQNAFGRIYMVGTGTITEEGDDPTPTVRESCRQCHIQGT